MKLDQKSRSRRRKRRDLREGGALSPDAAVMAEDRRGGEVLAVDIAHEVLINVSLPRHFLKVLALRKILSFSRDFLCFFFPWLFLGSCSSNVRYLITRSPARWAL